MLIDFGDGIRINSEDLQAAANAAYEAAKEKLPEKYRIFSVYQEVFEKAISSIKNKPIT